MNVSAGMQVIGLPDFLPRGIFASRQGRQPVLVGEESAGNRASLGSPLDVDRVLVAAFEQIVNEFTGLLNGEVEVGVSELLVFFLGFVGVSEQVLVDMSVVGVDPLAEAVQIRRSLKGFFVEGVFLGQVLLGFLAEEGFGLSTEFFGLLFFARGVEVYLLDGIRFLILRILILHFPIIRIMFNQAL